MTNQDYLNSVYATAFTLWDANTERAAKPLSATLSKLVRVGKVSEELKKTKDASASVAKLITLLDQRSNHPDLSSEVVSTLEVMEAILKSRS